jgi:peptidoglycan/xylan/chitin deacetylase (PgdA/CDA1 family)
MFRLLLSFFHGFALFYCTMLLAADHCVVLRYQHISDTMPGISSVTTKQFRQHLDYLQQHEYAVLPLEDVITALQNGGELPDRCIALTIDGAVASAYGQAFPLTQRYGFPLTVFVSTLAVDGDLDGFLNWTQIREMHAAGVSFQNLSHSYSHLIRRGDNESTEDWQQRIAFDIQQAQSRLAVELGSRPTLFAYPYGEYNEALQTIVSSMGLIGFGRQAGAVWRQADFTALPRFGLASFGARLRPFTRKIDAMPLPITGAFPLDPVVPVDEWQPSLTLVFKPGVGNRQELRCLLNGTPGMVYQWLEQPENAVMISPRGRLKVGRNRVDCTLPLQDGERSGWYSHNWIRRTAQGGWYNEPALAATAKGSVATPQESLRDKPVGSEIP